MNTFWQEFPAIAESLEKVSRIIQDSCASQNPVIAEGVSALFDGKGKLLRPGMLLIAANFGKKQDKHLKLAACLEILHMATLIHDDVIDDSPLRRGVPAAHARFGKRDAVLIGDYLLSRCFLLAAEYTSAANAVNLGKLLSRMCAMEIEQNADRFSSGMNLRRYLKKIMGKSAMLFSLACHVGGSEAKASRQITETLRRTGYNIGMAFQIIDDMLDYSGDAGAVGKPLGNDIKEGFVTLPLICAVMRDTSGMLRSFFSQPSFTVDDPDLIIKLVRENGGIEGARSYAEIYTNRALREIARLPSGAARNMLEKLTITLLRRDR
ncbi:MAG: polyprenyl synthetase family protein [Treponema sp.]|nr:polyprenyl synthetase family protein [Treponema sp.]